MAMALALVLSVVPASATTPEVGVDTTVTIGGSGNLPWVCAKFETPDDDPTTPGTQISPTGVFEQDKTVVFYVVVGDGSLGASSVTAVDVAVKYPDGSEKFQLRAIRDAPGGTTWTGERFDADGTVRRLVLGN